MVAAIMQGIEKQTSCTGMPPHNMFEFRGLRGGEDPVLKSLFMRETIKRGILFSGVQNTSFLHTGGDINKAIEVIKAVFEPMKKCNSEKRSRTTWRPLVQPVFRRS